MDSQELFEDEENKSNADGEVEMTYDEYLIYSARLGDLEGIKECLDESIALNGVDSQGNTALRK